MRGKRHPICTVILFAGLGVLASSSATGTEGMTYEDRVRFHRIGIVANSASSLGFSPDGKYLAVAGKIPLDDETVTGYVRVFDAATGELKKQLLEGASVDAVAFMPQGNKLVFLQVRGTRDNGAGSLDDFAPFKGLPKDKRSLRYWDMTSASSSASSIAVGRATIDSVDSTWWILSPDGSHLVVAARDRLRVHSLPGAEHKDLLSGKPAADELKIVFSIEIGQGGSVDRVLVKSKTTLPARTSDCMERWVSALRFPPGVKQPASVNYALVFPKLSIAKLASMHPSDDPLFKTSAIVGRLGGLSAKKIKQTVEGAARQLGLCYQSFALRAFPRRVAWLPVLSHDGRRMAAPTPASKTDPQPHPNFTLWDLTSLEVVHKLHIPRGSGRRLATAISSSRLVFVNKENSAPVWNVRVWNVATGKERGFASSDSVHDVTLTPDGERMGLVKEGRVEVRDHPFDRPLWEAEVYRPATMVFSPDQNRLAVVKGIANPSRGQLIELRDSKTGALLYSLAPWGNSPSVLPPSAQRNSDAEQSAAQPTNQGGQAEPKTATKSASKGCSAQSDASFTGIGTWLLLLLFIHWLRKPRRTWERRH